MPDSKYLGILVILLSIINFIILYSVSIELASISHVKCATADMFCTVYQHIPVVSWVGFPIFAGLIIVGVIIIYRSIKIEKVELKKVTKAVKSFKNLSSEEKKVLDIIIKYEGFAFQSDIIKESGFSKVKVSRILDRLETKGIVERRRRGMANIVVMKQN